MNAATQQKLDKLADRVKELNELLADPEVISIQKTFKQLSIELSDIAPIVTQYEKYKSCAVEVNEAKSMLTDNDPSIRRLAQDELPALKLRLSAEEKKKLHCCQKIQMTREMYILKFVPAPEAMRPHCSLGIFFVCMEHLPINNVGQ